MDGRKDAMVWNCFVIYDPCEYKWLAGGWRMALVYALSKNIFIYFEIIFGVADVFKDFGADNQIWKIGLTFCRA